MKAIFDFTYYLAGACILAWISVVLIALCVLVLVPLIEDIWAGFWRERQ